MPASTIPVTVDLHALFASLRRDLQRCSDLVQFGLRAEAGTVPAELDDMVPGAAFGFIPAEEAKVRGDEVAAAFRDWVLTCGLREAIEAVGPFLEEVRTITVLFDLWKEHRVLGSRDATVPSEQWNKRVIKGRAPFHRLGFPDKLELLQQVGPVAPALSPQVLSINQARNCLVHRRGVVTKRDVNGEGCLVVSWQRMTYSVRVNGILRPLEPPQYFEKAADLVVGREEAVKRIVVGEKVAFTAQEFSDICFTLVLFGEELLTQLSELGVRAGFLTPGPA